MSRTLVVAAITVWTALAVLGAWAMVRYESTPGPEQSAPPVWPSGTSLAQERERPTLLVFLHPLCSCSEATLSVLEDVLRERTGPLQAVAVFAIPDQADDADEPWRRSGLVRRAAAISGLTVTFDPGGHETRRFGGETSGFAAVYGETGRLLFSGGMTRGRGLTGSGASARGLKAALSGRAPASQAWQVFGCGLAGGLREAS